MLLLSFCGGGWRGVEWGVQSHFLVQPNFCVEVVLCCRRGCDNIWTQAATFALGFHLTGNIAPQFLKIMFYYFLHFLIYIYSKQTPDFFQYIIFQYNPLPGLISQSDTPNKRWYVVVLTFNYFISFCLLPGKYF